MTKTNTYEITLSTGEEELVLNLQSGNHNSFKKIYDRFAAVLYGTIMNWIKDSQIAENLLQDVFIKAWTNREVYNAEKGRLFTWLYNISRNVCIDYFRSRQYKQRRVSLLSDDMSALLTGTKKLNQSCDTIGVRELLNQLRIEEKQVIELMYFKGLTQNEISKLMDMPLGTVKTRMNMAIKNLRRVFVNDWKQAQQLASAN